MDRTTGSRVTWAGVVSALVRRPHLSALVHAPIPQNDPRTTRALSR